MANRRGCRNKRRGMEKRIPVSAYIHFLATKEGRFLLSRFLLCLSCSRIRVARIDESELCWDVLITSRFSLANSCVSLYYTPPSAKIYRRDPARRSPRSVRQFTSSKKSKSLLESIASFINMEIESLLRRGDRGGGWRVCAFVTLDRVTRERKNGVVLRGRATPAEVAVDRFE